MKMVTEHIWKTAFSDSGVLHIENVIWDIQRGGVEPKIRPHVWEFLVGVYKPFTTAHQRKRLRDHRKLLFNNIKKDCASMYPCIGTTDYLSEGSHINFSEYYEATNNPQKLKWFQSLEQITKDVLRTDRDVSFYKLPQNLAKLRDVLAIYAWLDQECGYAQGMNDLCSYICYVFEDEADAFWCFHALMQKYRYSFFYSAPDAERMGVYRQIEGVYYIMKAIYPKLHNQLLRMTNGEYSFLFIEILLLLFKRVFVSFQKGMLFWDMMFAAEYVVERPAYFLGFQHGNKENKRRFCSRRRSKAYFLGFQDGNKDNNRSFCSNRRFNEYKRSATMHVNTDLMSPNDEREMRDPDLPFVVYITAAFVNTTLSKLKSRESWDISDAVQAIKSEGRNIDGMKLITAAMSLRRKCHNDLKSLSPNKRSNLRCISKPEAEHKSRINCFLNFIRLKGSDTSNENLH